MAENALEGKNKGLAGYPGMFFWDMGENMWVTKEQEKSHGLKPSDQNPEDYEHSLPLLPLRACF